MRLRADEIQTIITAAQKIFGQGVKVSLFGSRVDNSKRGGDIDLLVDHNNKAELTRDRKRELWGILQENLGEQKIDIVLDDAHFSEKGMFAQTIKDEAIQLMMSNEKDKLKEALKLCEVHYKSMSYAFGKFKIHMPLTSERYEQLTEDDKSYCDQLVFRFSRLQDAMGSKLFPAILENNGEEARKLPFIDILNRLEQLGVIDDAHIWKNLRDIRNDVTHDYPFVVQQLIDDLNKFMGYVQKISTIWSTIESYCNNKFNLDE